MPVRALLAQGAWASLLAISGTYDTLTDSVMFASWLFYGLVAGALFVFRRTLPDAPRAFRAPGYPVIPIVFLLATAGASRQYVRRDAAAGVAGRAMLLVGLPFYLLLGTTSPDPTLGRRPPTRGIAPARLSRQRLGDSLEPGSTGMVPGRTLDRNQHVWEI